MPCTVAQPMVMATSSCSARILQASSSGRMHKSPRHHLQTRPSAGRCRPAFRTCRAADKETTATEEKVQEAFSVGGQNIGKALKELPAEQQKALSQMYLFLVQNSNHAHNIRLQNWRDMQRAIAEDYQVLVWRPAELLNGRMAMIGFTLGFLTQLRTGQTVWAQLNAFPAAYLVAYGMVVLASLLNDQFGRPKEGISIGPIKFSHTAELFNARAAMVGYAILMYVGYNTELQRAAFAFLQRMQQGQLPGVSV